MNYNLDTDSDDESEIGKICNNVIFALGVRVKKIFFDFKSSIDGHIYEYL